MDSEISKPRSRPRKEIFGGAPSKPDQTPTEFLLETMRNPFVDLRMRIAAAKALLPFTAKTAGVGKESGLSLTTSEDNVVSWASILAEKR